MAKPKPAPRANRAEKQHGFPTAYDPYASDPTGGYGTRKPTAAPTFSDPEAQALYNELAAKPANEPPLVKTARQVLANTKPGPARQAAYEALVARTGNPDHTGMPTSDPAGELDGIRVVVDEIERAEAAAASTEIERQVTEALQPAEPPAPYLDDSGALRDPSGHIVDAASEDWWDASWAGEAAKLLGPEWMAGHNPGED